MILVDPLKTYVTRLRHKTWCHMVSTSGLDELHEFALRLGLRTEWAQLRPRASAAHYDLLPIRRNRAVALGAIDVSTRELARRNFDGRTQRQARGELPPTKCRTCGGKGYIDEECESAIAGMSAPSNLKPVCDACDGGDLLTAIPRQLPSS